MAIIMVAGNVVNMPALFNSVRFLTTGIVSEMSYAFRTAPRGAFQYWLGIVCIYYDHQYYIEFSFKERGRKECINA